MKKLMIAAAAAAMVGGVFAANCTKDAVDCAEVYDVVMNLKTTKCLCQDVSTTIAGSGCVKDTTVQACKAWRVVTTKKVYGVIWQCECTCSTNLGPDESPLMVAPTIWDPTTGTAIAGGQFFWMPSEKIYFDYGMTFKYLARIGAVNGKVEAWGTFGDGVNFAGFGTHGALRTKTISGGVAGCWGAPYDCSTQTTPGVFDSDCPAYDLCDLTLANANGIDKTAVYGSFTVKYNASKSAKYATGVFFNNVVPAQVGGLKANGTNVACYESSAM